LGDLLGRCSARLAVEEEAGVPGIVHVVDDDRSFRTAVERRLKLAGYEVEAYVSAQEFLDRLPTAEKRGCILLDVQMPKLTGLELQSFLAEVGSILPIIFVTGYSDTPTTVRAVKAGAEDFLIKPVSSEQIIEAIERAMMRFDSNLNRRNELDMFRRLMATLTPRERQVFNLIVLGKINKRIAYELGTTERTVKAHRHMVREKMQVGSLAELVSIAERLNLIKTQQD
jgi:FixJ family two-component response regulator